MSIAADQPPTAASAHLRSSANRSKTSRSAHPWWMTTAMARARLFPLASTQTQAFCQTHQQLARTRRPTVKRMRPRHQAQAAPGATAMTSLEKSHKKSNTTKSARSHSPTLNAKLHASTSLQQLVPHHRARQVSPHLCPSGKPKTMPQRQPRQLSWRRDHVINSFRRRWALLALVLRHHIHLICLSRHSRLLRHG
jgi:hypothetical protein